MQTGIPIVQAGSSFDARSARPGRRVLITGVSGFTGRHLEAALRSAGYEVFGLSHDEDADVRVFRCDLGDRTQLEEIVRTVAPDIVVHLAAISFVAHDDVDAFYRVNLLGTLNLLRVLAAASHTVGKVLLASSANIYGNAEVLPIHEGVPPAPVNDYAVSKLAMEHAARLWFERLPIVIVRPFNYTGVGQGKHFLLPKIVDHFRRRAAVLELGNLDVERDFSDVRTVVECYRRLIESDVRSEVVNICSGHARSLADILGMMRELCGYTPEIRVNPAFVRSNEVKCLVGSRARLDALVGPTPSVPLVDTLRWMLESDA